jgi:hypothetical protein
MFDVLVCCYGNYHDIAKRCLGSVVDLSSQSLNIHVGLNECGIDTKNYCRNLLDNNKITTIIDSRINLNKDPMMRKLIDCVNSEYFLWLDDDSYIIERDWDLKVIDHISNNSFDISGFSHISNRYSYGDYQKFLESRSWYQRIFPHPEDPSRCDFPVGGVWIGRAAYLRQHDYPDRSMIKKCDDMLLGDLLQQTGGRFTTLFGWDSVFKVNQAQRRGFGESDNDFIFGDQ